MNKKNQFKTKKSVFYGCLFLSILFIYSCDYLHVKDYYVINNYADSVSLKYAVNSIEENTIININDTLLIYSAEYVMGTVGVNDNRELLSVKEMTMNYQGNEKSIEKSDWIYQELGKYHAEYFLIVDSAFSK